MDIYRCSLCGNIVVKLVHGGGTLSCCGQEMVVLKAGTTDASVEKHVPALTLNGNTLSVQVGDVVHPMTAEHYIQFILAVQGENVQYKLLSPEQEPKAEFEINPKLPVEVYEYCNLHSLWKKDLQ